MDDESEDGSIDLASSDFPEYEFSDFVAQRALAFGSLAKLLETLQDESSRELGKAMLKAVIRSIKTPPSAELAEIG